MKELLKLKTVKSLQKLTLTQSVKDMIRSTTNDDALQSAILNNRKYDFFKLTYLSNGNLITGYIVQPKNIDSKTPILIYNRGGTNDFGALKLHTIYNYLSRFAGWGYIVFASQYSGNSESEGIDEYGGVDVEDVLTLKKIIDKHPFSDNKKIGVIGVSRGGLMTYQLLKRVKWIKAAVTVAGIADLHSMITSRPEMRNALKNHFKISKQTVSDRSAVDWADKFSNNTPLLLLHGTADWRVDVTQSINLATKLYTFKKPFKLVVYPGADHMLSEFRSEYLAETHLWLDLYLKGGAPMPNLELHGK